MQMREVKLDVGMFESFGGHVAADHFMSNDEPFLTGSRCHQGCFTQLQDEGTLI